MTHEVSAVAKPPQTTPLFRGICVDARGGNGEYRRCAPRGESHNEDRQNGTTGSRNGEAAQRRGGGDTRRFPPAYRRECLNKGGLSAAVLPPPILRTSLVATHSRRFTTQNSLFNSTGYPSHRRTARRVLVIPVPELQTKDFFDSYSGIGILDGVGRSEVWTAVSSYSAFPEITIRL
jgi:hypothetical protein